MDEFILDNYEIKDSDIDGKGVFAIQAFKPNEFINIALVGQKTTHFGKFLNHSDFPNAKTKKGENNYRTYALNPIKAGEEITVDYTVNKDLEQPESGWNYFEEAIPNNGVWTNSRPKGEDETITSLYKGTVPQGKNAKVKVDEDDDVEESTTANQPNPAFSMGVDKNPDDSYLNLLKKSVKPKKITIRITKDDRKADPFNKVH